MPAPSNQRYPVVNTFPLRGWTAAALAASTQVLNHVALWEGSQTREAARFFSFHRPGRYAYLGFEPQATLTVGSDGTLLKRRNGEQLSLTTGGTPLDVLRVVLATEFPASPSPLTAPFAGGAIGFLGYDAVRTMEKVSGAAPHPREPDLMFYIFDRLAVLDYERGDLHLVVWSDGESSQSRAEAAAESARLAAIFKAAQETAPRRQGGESPHSESCDFSLYFERKTFLEMVSRAQEYIVAGDIFQVVLSNSFTVPFSPDPLSLYQILKQQNPSPYHFLVRFGDHAIVGASPEVMLRAECRDGETKVYMRPVAGTYPRASDQEEDDRRAAALREDEKERAEHVMLVDLERNDIGRVSRAGSVHVSDLFSVETYAHVHHLVSQVSGTLKPGEDALSALQSCFPIGTLAGTPKIRAMEIIAELEQVPRGIFGGAIAMLSCDGTLDSCVAIRAAVVGPRETTVKTGAGIVYDSDPAREFDECLWKARSLFRALAVAGER